MNKTELIEALEKAGYARHDRQLKIPAAAAQTIIRQAEIISELREYITSIQCSVEGCDSVSYAKGFCNRHYKRMKKYGTVDGSGYPDRGELLGFLKKIVADPPEDKCVLWPYGTNSYGYGALHYEGRAQTASRVSLTLYSGHTPSSLEQAAHAPIICHNRLCVNPLHLRWDTVAGNNADKFIDNTVLRGEHSPCSKLTGEIAFKMFQDNRTLDEIAKDYGVSPSTVGHIKRGNTWRHVTGMPKYIPTPRKSLGENNE